MSKNKNKIKIKKNTKKEKEKNGINVKHCYEEKRKVD